MLLLACAVCFELEPISEVKEDADREDVQSINQYLFFKTTPQDFLIEEG